MIEKYRICSRCIMDSTDPDIVFDNNGVCNHCHRYDLQKSLRTFPENEREARLDELISDIKKRGRNKKYDCIIGVSGGVDSTYVAYITRKLGLRPLAVHFDNGWNSELAVANIEKALSHLDIDLYTFVVDWEEFRDLQLSFLKASTPDGEVPTDHAIVALLYELAVKQGVKYILLGTNVASEAIMPLKWGYGYSDYRYIYNIQKKYGTKKLRTYPHYNLVKLFEYMIFRKIKIVSILDYIIYDKEEAMQTIQKELGWIYYGGKHYESIYTRFYQSYILPRKFNIDKRRAHYSNLVLSNQLTREEALDLMDEPIFAENGLREDREYVIKKLQLNDTEFEKLMNLPTKTFDDYKTHYQTIELLKKVARYLNLKL